MHMEIGGENPLAIPNFLAWYASRTAECILWYIYIKS